MVVVVGHNNYNSTLYYREALELHNLRRPPHNLLTAVAQSYGDRRAISWRSSKDIRKAFFAP